MALCASDAQTVRTNYRLLQYDLQGAQTQLGFLTFEAPVCSALRRHASCCHASCCIDWRVAELSMQTIIRLAANPIAVQSFFS